MGILDTSYYGWRTIAIIESTAEIIYEDVGINDIAEDSKGNLYACGYVQKPNLLDDWIVLKSTDSGNSWSIIDYVNRNNSIDQSLGIAIDSNDNIYACGFETASNRNWIVRKSTTGNSGSFFYIDSVDRDGANDSAWKIAIDSNDNVYVCGQENVSGGPDRNWIVRKSTTGNSGSFSTIDSVDRDGSDDEAYDIAIDSNDNVYVCGYETVLGGPGRNWIVRKSTTGNSGSFFYIDSVDRSGNNDFAYGIAIDSNDNVYVCGTEDVGSSNQNWIVRKSTTGNSGSFFYIDSVDRDGARDTARGIAIDSNDNVYACGQITFGSENDNLAIRKSTTGNSGSFSYIDYLNNNDTFDTLRRLFIDSNDNIFAVGESGGKGILRKGKLTSNSASLGSQMLATSFGYVFSESFSNTNDKVKFGIDERFKLNNVSEFPHSSGLFQMKNMVLGTQTSGRVGKDIEENIVSINHIGSFVQIMWPKQDNAKSNVKGFGDLSAGQKIGKLDTNWSPGEFYDVTKYDRATLWNYLQKRASGSLDEVQIRIERRPLRSTGFTIDQGIEDKISGSNVVSQYRDHIHTKEINYGDLSMKEIGWPIDLDLKNTKELRVSVKHKNGQTSEDNKNFIVWGRFLSPEETT